MRSPQFLIAAGSELADVLAACISFIFMGKAIGVFTRETKPFAENGAQNNSFSFFSLY